MTNSIGIFFAALYSGFLAWSVWESNQRDQGNREGPRYAPFLGNVTFPLLLLALLILCCFHYSLTESLSLLASTFFGAFLHICIYNVLLLAVVPFLRGKISARACGYLWIIPNILYLSQTQIMSPDHPIWVIHLPDSLLQILTIVWIFGFVAVLLYQFLNHVIFRHRIMKNATPVQDSVILELWKQEQINAGIEKATYKLLCSSAVRTPLSIGLWNRSIRVILPHTNYSGEELQLIFRHELIHICREDVWSKFSLVFCTAVCWFNPLMWISMHKSFDDLELSCDETVLLHADDTQRRQYADLLLKTAGQEQGFTTCLSASASALRYRLKNSVKPRKLRSGALTVGLVSFLLLTTCGSVALAYDSGTGKDAVFFGQNSESYRLSSIRDTENSSYRDYICRDPDRLKEYLSDLPLQKLTGNYDFKDLDHSLVLLFDTPNGILGMDLNDTTVNITKFWGENITQECFYISGGLDWNFLDTVIQKMPAVEIQLTGPRNTEQSSGTIDTVVQVCEGNSETILGPMISEETCTGIYGTFEYETMTLHFPEPPLSPVSVTISSWDWSESETMTLSSPNQEIPLTTNSAHFRISAAFAGPDGSIYETVFRFDLQNDTDELRI